MVGWWLLLLRYSPNFLKIPNNLQATGLGGGCYCVTLPNFQKIPNNLQTTGLYGCYCTTLPTFLKISNNLQTTGLGWWLLLCYSA